MISALSSVKSRNAHPSFVHREELLRHVHEVVLAVLTAKVRLDPALDGFERLEGVHLLIL